MRRYIVLIVIAAPTLSLAGPHEPVTWSENASRQTIQYAPYFRLNGHGQQRAARASVPTTDLRRPSANALRPRVWRERSISDQSSRLADAEQPHTSRTPIIRNPHATDPDAPRQATTRSDARNLRAPAAPAPQRTPPSLSSRMTLDERTRMTRATFEDWLFGR